jgi:hypothetical protein
VPEGADDHEEPGGQRQPRQVDAGQDAPGRPARQGAEGAGPGQRLVEQHRTEEQRQDLAVDQGDRLVQVDDARRQQRRRPDQGEAGALLRHEGQAAERDARQGHAGDDHPARIEGGHAPPRLPRRMAGVLVPRCGPRHAIP